MYSPNIFQAVDGEFVDLYLKIVQENSEHVKLNINIKYQHKLNFEHLFCLATLEIQ